MNAESLQTSSIENATAATDRHHTVWGMTPGELHDRFWASRGVQVVRPGEPSEIVEGAEMFLLMNPQILMIFRLRTLVDQISWTEPDILWVRVCDKRERGFSEKAVTDDHDRLIRFERIYSGADSRLARAALTPKPDIARFWQSAPNARTAWRQLWQHIPSVRRAAASVTGRTYVRDADYEIMQFMRDLIPAWTRPDVTVDRAHRVQPGVWGDRDSHVAKNTKFIGPAWVGAGRQLATGTSVIGPAILWDDPSARPAAAAVRWDNLEHTQVRGGTVQPRDQSPFERRAKRIFDVAIGTMALLLVLPIFPVIMLAVWLEDGGPLFFAHRRETVGGRPFPCLKFRSMRKNAEEIKALLAKQNEADGPQFFVQDDPRLTRVGRILRKFQLDELPQLFNVLAGHMSIVGPRPSPYEENQYSPTWREARLSVRPGITGLWQVKRTRQRGLDFQEWIKYDIEYVEKRSFWLDLWIIWKTMQLCLKKGNH